MFFILAPVSARRSIVGSGGPQTFFGFWNTCSRNKALLPVDDAKKRQYIEKDVLKASHTRGAPNFMNNSFHLSLAVRSMDESIHFFTQVLGNRILHKDPSGYVNIDFFGAELTLKPNTNANPDIPDFHFGINLSLAEFDALTNQIVKKHKNYIAMEPKIMDEGTPLERKKMYLRCPTGYLVELKGYKGTTLPAT